MNPKFKQFLLGTWINMCLYASIIIGLWTGNEYARNAGLTVVWVVIAGYAFIGFCLAITERTPGEGLKHPTPQYISLGMDTMLGIQLGGAGFIATGALLIFTGALFHFGISFHDSD